MRITSKDEAMDYLSPLLVYLSESDMIEDEDSPLAYEEDDGGCHRTGEKASATFARRIARLILDASMSNGLGGCKLCAS